VLGTLPIPVRTARRALDLARRQPQDLAQLADRAARTEGGEGCHQRRAVVPVAVVHARDQQGADVAREVQVDVGQAREVFVQEAPQRQLAGDRIDVREARQVADERGHRRAPPPPRRQQRAHRVRPADLDGDLARQLQHVVVQ
jgi:hypothetical protein